MMRKVGICFDKQITPLPEKNPFEKIMSKLDHIINSYVFPTVDIDIIPSDVPMALEELLLLLQDAIFNKADDISGQENVIERMDIAMKNIRRLLRRIEKTTYTDLSFRDKDVIKDMMEVRRQYFFIKALLSHPEKWDEITRTTGIEGIITERLPTLSSYYKTLTAPRITTTGQLKEPTITGNLKKCLDLIMQGPKSPANLSQNLGVTIQMVYKYLNKLLNFGLVKSIKEGRLVKYTALTPEEREALYKG